MSANPSAKADSHANWETQYSHRLRSGALLLVAVNTVIITLVLVWLLLHTGIDFWKSIFFEHFAATLGLAAASAGAFGVVVFLRQSEGPFEFELWGMKAKGASGQVVMWGFSVLVYSLCAWMLWNCVMPKH